MNHNKSLKKVNVWTILVGKNFSRIGEEGATIMTILTLLPNFERGKKRERDFYIKIFEHSHYSLITLKSKSHSYGSHL